MTRTSVLYRPLQTIAIIFVVAALGACASTNSSRSSHHTEVAPAMAFARITEGGTSFHHTGSAKHDSLYEIGSLTKPFVATLWHHPALSARELRSTPIAAILYGDHAGRTLARHGHSVTPAQLIAHTSGLPRVPSDLTQGFDPNQPYAHYDELRLLQTTDRVMLRQRPGRRFEYSNYGYALLGIALERTEDRSLEDLLKEYITGPLGMSDTTIALGPDQRTRLVAPHTATGQQTAPWGGSAMGAFEAAGAMHASIGDMAAWADFQRQVLADPGRVREKHSELASLVTAVESSHSSIRALPVGSAATTSGWFVRRFTKGGPAYLYHDGITGGFTAHMAVSVDGSHAFVMLANQAPSDAQTDMFLRELQATHTAAKR